MDEDSSLMPWICMALALLILAGGMYGAYRRGRLAERKDLTPFIEDGIEQAFWQGYDMCKQQEGIRERREYTER